MKYVKVIVIITAKVINKIIDFTIWSMNEANKRNT